MAETLIIDGGTCLKGEVDISGAKNASLPIMAAALLGESESILHNVPQIEDVETMIDVLKSLGTEIHKEKNTLIIKPTIKKFKPPYESVKKMRASFYVAGPLLSRFHKAEIPLPGGCVIGSRPVDFHIAGFKSMGANVSLEHGYMKAVVEGKLKGAKIYLDPRWNSVGTTLNLTMAATLAEGETIIENAARDPEISDLIIFLNKMGAKIKGRGTNTLIIQGVKKLQGVEHSVFPDRIEAGTFLIAGAITKGEVTVNKINPELLTIVLSKLQAIGLSVKQSKNHITLKYQSSLKAIDIITAPYPGFPTDLQPLITALLTLAPGTSLVEETIHDSRFRYVDELKRMGADIMRVDNTAVVKGVEILTGAPVEASDLRAGAALVIAGLAAEGQTKVIGMKFVKRGYENFEEKLTSLGAKVKVVK